jgi:heme/copper-type cytochrome/quinol oxidase subunit 4
MASHFFLMVLFSCFVSVVFAVLMRDKPEDQIRFGAMLFAAFVLVGVTLGWLMYPFPL